MNRAAWSEDDLKEYEEALRQAADISKEARLKAREFLRLLAIGIQAHRIWALEVEDECSIRGAAGLVKAWEKRQNLVMVAHDGRLLTKTALLGSTEIDDDGEKYYQQSLFHVMTWDQLVAKQKEYRRQIAAYGDNVFVMQRLLALRKLAPETRTPAEAAKLLGITVEAWLAEETS